MKQSEDVRVAQVWADRVRSAGLSLGLVPTMGALHAGHYSLIERARSECDRVCVSIFVNPTQFGPNEDLDRYPRSEEKDAAECRERGVDFVLSGKSSGDDGIYAQDFQSWLQVEKLSKPLCGRFRPGHFRGVATVVAILFEIFKPHRAYFGRKDFQQGLVIRRFAEDLRSGVDVRLLPTVRDGDGLAVSSRNRMLSDEQREIAISIPRALDRARAAFEAGEESAECLETMVESDLSLKVGLELQYVSALDVTTLEGPGQRKIRELDAGAVLAVAAVVGAVRLIDNVWLRRGVARAPEADGETR